MEMNKCLCGCDKPVWSRGLCHAAYQYANRLIHAGKTSWPILVANGKALESKAGQNTRYPNNERQKFFLGKSE